jgi:2-hydroxychromene-2-carboxylate isomerase
MKVIEYFFSPVSPWTYLGHEQLRQIAKRHNATIELLPIELGSKIFPISGGLPLLKRPIQRQTYRLAELARWQQFLNLPMNIQPQYFPVSDAPALQAIAAASQFASNETVFEFSGSLMRAVWVEQRNVADPQVIDQIAHECQIDSTQLVAHAKTGREQLDRNNQRAIEAQVFGAPWFRYQQDNFWGQDRLDFLDRALT